MPIVIRLLSAFLFGALNLAASCEAPPPDADSPGPIRFSSPSTEASPDTERRPGPATAVPGNSKLVRFTLRITPDGVEVLSKVDAPGALNRRDPNRDSPTVFRVVTGDNRIIFERGFQMPGERHGEFADSEGNLTRVRGPAETPIVSIVVPVDTTAAKLQLIRKALIKDGTAARSTAPAEELIGEVPL